MGSISSSFSVLGFVNLDVADDKILDFEIFNLSVGVKVLEKSEDNFTGFLWPSSYFYV